MRRMTWWAVAIAAGAVAVMFMKRPKPDLVRPEATVNLSEEEQLPEASAKPVVATDVRAVRKTEPSIADQNAEYFRQLAKEVSQSIPTIHELKNLPESETHRTPRVLREAGAQLGRMAEALDRNPSLIPQAIGYYKDCSLNDDYPSSVRALCFSNASRLLKQRNEPFPESSSIPESIQRLAKELD